MVRTFFTLLFLFSLGALSTALSAVLLEWRPWAEEPIETPAPMTPSGSAEPAENTSLHPRLRDLAFWQRPEGPARVALQVGHWQASEAPEEQKGLRVSTGASAGGHTEWETMLVIAQKTKALLEKEGITVELLPVTIPPNYWADVFVSLHADGNVNGSVSGYKAAAPRFDYTRKSERLSRALDEEYGRITSLPYDDEITRQMRGYYAFNWMRYEHSIHPLTAAAIIETGFLTNTRDRQFLVHSPDQAAAGIATGILRYLQEEEIGR